MEILVLTMPKLVKCFTMSFFQLMTIYIYCLCSYIYITILKYIYIYNYTGKPESRISNIYVYIYISTEALQNLELLKSAFYEHWKWNKRDTCFLFNSVILWQIWVLVKMPIQYEIDKIVLLYGHVLQNTFTSVENIFSDFSTWMLFESLKENCLMRMTKLLKIARHLKRS